MEYLTLKDIPDPYAQLKPHALNGMLPSISNGCSHPQRHSPPFQEGDISRSSGTVLPGIEQMLGNGRSVQTPPTTPVQVQPPLVRGPIEPPVGAHCLEESNGATKRKREDIDVLQRLRVVDDTQRHDASRTSRPYFEPLPISPPAHAHNPTAFDQQYRGVQPQYPSAAPSRSNSQGYASEDSFASRSSWAPYGSPQSPPFFTTPNYQQQAHQHNDYQFQHMAGVDDGQFQRKRRGNLPKEATNILKTWYNTHLHSPYPTEDEKYQLMHQTQLTLNQVSNWFINQRRRNPSARRNDSHQQNGSTTSQGSIPLSQTLPQPQYCQPTAAHPQLEKGIGQIQPHGHLNLSRNPPYPGQPSL